MDTAANYGTDEDIPCRGYTLIYAKSLHIRIASNMPIWFILFCVRIQFFLVLS